MTLTASSSSAIVIPLRATDQTAPTVPAWDREAVRRFLQLLDPAPKGFTLQTFADGKENASLARSNPSRHEILRLYQAGAGVYVTVNETDLNGRKSENIKRVRAVWQEDDEGHGGPFPLEPSAVVESSPGRFHRYWFVADEWAADDQGRADFAAVMERMVASYGSDKNAKDLSRVLRVPGFLHRKDPTRPHMVRIVKDSDRRYRREEIIRAFPPVEHEKPQARNDWRAGDSDEERIADALHAVPADDRDIWLQIGMALKSELGDGGRPLWDRWSATCTDKFKDRDQERAWRSFRRNGIGIGTLFYYAKQHGWSPPRRDPPIGVSVAPVASVASASPVASDTWPTMNDAAFYGIAGDLVRTVEPHTEADPVAVLVQFLTCAGSIIGRAPYHKIEGNHHHANLFSVLVGESAKSRKGTAWGRVCEVAKIADDVWYRERIKGGLSSGEGFIGEVRDPVTKWNPKEKVLETSDPGVSDKRLMVVEPEFASVLAVAERQGNTLTSHIRQAWDGGILSTMTRSSPLRATGAHVSIVGHITIDELRARLTRTDAANGFANRFLFLLVKRSKVLPFGGDSLDDIAVGNLGASLKEAVERASKLGRIGWSTAGAEAWKAVYEQLSEGKPGLLGAVIARAEAQCIRLAMTYALLDGATNIDLPHLNAAIAFWDYAEASAAHIFGASLGDDVADEILRALRHNPQGINRTAIRDLFGRNQSSGRISAALALLASRGKANVSFRETGGRPMEMWTAAESLHG